MIANDPGATAVFTPEQDVIITGYIAFGTGIISLEPDLTQAIWAAGIFNGVQTQLRLIISNVVPAVTGLNIQLLKGQKLYFNSQNGSAICQLYLLTSSGEPSLGLV